MNGGRPSQVSGRNRVFSLFAGACSVALVSACYLTSDFNGIADGTRPADGGGSDAGLCVPGQHLICSTFDNGALNVDGWTVPAVQGTGSSAALNMSQSVSPPASFQSLIPANATTAAQLAVITQSVATSTTYTTLTLAFDYRLEACTSQGGGITIVAITPAASTLFGFVYSGSGLEWGQVVGGSTFISAKLASQPVQHAWVHVVVTITNPKAPVVDITFDGTPVVSGHASTAFVPASKIEVDLGANGTGPNAQCQMEFDNVTFDSK